MEAADLELRRQVYRLFVELGRAPTREELGGDDVEDGLRRLHDAHALVLHPGTTEIRMANPFSAVPTPHRVECEGRSWYANCAWDALGIPAALHADGRVESECADCGERVELEVRDGRLARGADLLVHFLVPARRWWDDIGFT
jgi:hypothetical protein